VTLIESSRRNGKCFEFEVSATKGNGVHE